MKDVLYPTFPIYLQNCTYFFCVWHHICTIVLYFQNSISNLTFILLWSIILFVKVFSRNILIWMVESLSTNINITSRWYDSKNNCFEIWEKKNWIKFIYLVTRSADVNEWLLSLILANHWYCDRRYISAPSRVFDVFALNLSFYSSLISVFNWKLARVLKHSLFQS